MPPWPVFLKDSTASVKDACQLLWVLALSCLFSWVMMEPAGRFVLVTGDTAVHGCRIHLAGGKWLAILMVIGVVTGQWCCLSGLVGLSAGLSSVFPICMVAPLLIGDYRRGEFDSHSTLFRTLCGVACVLGLAVPVFGANPIAAQIATQVSLVFVLPLVIGVFFALLNNRALMGAHRAGWVLNTGMVIAFAFSLVMSFVVVKGLTGVFR